MKNLQKGRSMIEMLGVLAIVGVLSIGGLAGYTMAMNRWRANTLMDYVTRCVVVAQTKNLTGAPANSASMSEASNCSKILKEAFPGFLGGTTPQVWISSYDRDTDETQVKAGVVSAAVEKVLYDKLKTRVNGVAYTKGSESAGGTGTFSFMNAAPAE